MSKKFTIEDMRELSVAELAKKVTELKKKQLKAFVARGAGETTNVKEVSFIKKEIAQILTIITQKEKGIEVKKSEKNMNKKKEAKKEVKEEKPKKEKKGKNK